MGGKAGGVAMNRDARLILACLSLAAFQSAGAAQAFAQAPQTGEETDEARGGALRFDIPALPVNQALLVFGRQAGVTVVFTAPPGTSLPTSRPVEGRMTRDQAITRLLAGTGLAPERVDAQTYAVRLAPAPTPRPQRRSRSPDPAPIRPTPPTETEAEIIVTGTRRQDITSFTSVAGVDVIGGDTLRAANTSGELVTTLSTLASSIDAPRSTLNGTPEAVRNIRFRGLNPDQLLVLVNGQRRHTSAVVHASSIYRGAAGADINAIPQIAIARIEVLRDGAAAQYGSDAVTGVINFILKDQPVGGEINATLGAHVTHVPVLGETFTDGASLVIAADQGFRLGTHGALRLGGEVTTRGETNRAGFDQIPPFVQLPRTSPLRGARNYHLGDGELTNLNLYSTFDSGEFSEQFSIFGHTTIGLRSAESAYFFRYPGTASTDDALYPNGFRPLAVGHNVDLAASLGLRGAFADWSLEIVGSHGANYFENRLDTTLNASLGPASPTSFRIGALAYQQTGLQVTGVFEPTEASSFTMGTEVRLERHRTNAADPAAYQVGPFVGREIGAQGGGVITPADESERSRTSLSAFAALEIDATETLSIIAAARVDSASDYETAWTGRLGANWALGPFMLRASGSRNYRAPHLGQLNYRVTNTDFSEDLRLVQQLNLGGANPVLPAFGFERLRPETSTNWTFGAGFRAGEFQITADAYVIAIADRIASTPLISAEAAVATAGEVIGAPVDSIRFPINRFDTQTVGVDVAASTRWRVWEGDLDLRAGLSLVETRIEAIAPIPERLRALAPNMSWNALNAEFGNVPFSHIDLQATYRNENWDFSWRSMRFGRSEEPRRGAPSNVQVFAPDWRHDAAITWRPIDGIEARLGAENLLDAYPDETEGVEAYYGNFPYSYGRPIGINGRYVFASLRKYW
jgi:iron complex outermembrane recepter protein